MSDTPASMEYTRYQEHIREVSLVVQWFEYCDSYVKNSFDPGLAQVCTSSGIWL